MEKFPVGNQEETQDVFGKPETAEVRRQILDMITEKFGPLRRERPRAKVDMSEVYAMKVPRGWTFRQAQLVIEAFEEFSQGTEDDDGVVSRPEVNRK